MAWRWLLVNQVLLLSYIALCDMTCNTDGVKCVATPNGCTADCDYLLKYKAASSDTTQVKRLLEPLDFFYSALQLQTFIV